MRRRRSRREEYTQLTFFLVSLSNPAPADFRYSKEDKGREELGGEREGVNNITVSRAPVLFHKHLKTQRGDDHHFVSFLPFLIVVTISIAITRHRLWWTCGW